jgi:hypothetical protein
MFNLLQVYSDGVAVAEDMEVLAADVTGDPIVARIKGDLETLLKDLGLSSLLGDKPNDESAIFNSLPILSRLRLSDRDKTELTTFAAECKALAEKPEGLGKINWCNIVKAMQATIAALTAAGLPIPAYLTIVVQIVSSLCPAGSVATE